MAKFIVAIEAVKIKEFLFSTNKLKVIRGASYLLDYLNRVEVPKTLEKHGIKKDDRIYIGAGNAKFFVEGENEKDTLTRVKAIINEVKEKYETEAPGAKIVGVYTLTEYRKGLKSPQGREVWKDIDELARLTAIEKSKGFSTINIDLPCVEKCELSGNELAEISVDKFSGDLDSLGFNIKDEKLIFTDGDKEYSIGLPQLKKRVKDSAENTGKISDASFRKILFAYLLKEVDKIDNVGFYNDIKGYIKDDDTKTNIGDFQDNNSFIGLMYSDGDGLGDFLKGSKEKFIKLLETNDKAEDEYLEFMGKFSEELDRTTKNSLATVLEEVFSKSEDKDKWGEFLIVGGDDVCAVFPPNLVMEISVKFQEKFENDMANKMCEITKNSKDKIMKEITSSSGVIIAKVKTPMFQLFDQALALQKEAKKARKNAVDLGLNKTGFIDFEVIGSEGCTDIKKFRENLKECKVMERPYSIALNEEDRKKANFKNIDSLLNLIKDMKQKGFPTNKLRYIYDLKVDKSKESFEKKMDLINILSKMNDSQVAFIKNNFNLKHDTYENFEEDFVNIFDILELYKFVGKEGETNEN